MDKLSFVVAVCASSWAWAQDAQETKEVNEVQEHTVAWPARLEELWKKRETADGLKQNEEALTEALKASPQDYEVLWRAARLRWWVADGSTDEKQKKQMAKEGWNFAKRAIELKPDAVEGKYFAAINIGAYSQAVGILKALTDGLEGQFVDNLDFAIKKQDTFENCGGLTAKGRYYWELPWPKRDLSKSKATLEKAIEKCPTHLRNFLYLADTLLKDGDARGAKVAVEKAVNGAVEYDPPEAHRIQAWAKALSAKIDAALK